MYKAKVITVSDRCFNNERVDEAGPIVKKILINAGYEAEKITIGPDEEKLIIDALNGAVNSNFDLIVTTGGTGFSKRDITPECTKKVIDKEAPGIAEYMRQSSMQITKRAMLSRGVCGLKNNSLIINLPGSEKAARENLEAIIETIEHGLKMLNNSVNDCAKLI